MDDRAVVEAVAARVRALRKERGWSLDVLSTRAQVSKGVLVSLENGRSNPNLATLVRLCDAFGEPLTSLLSAPEPLLLQAAAPEEQSVLWTGPDGGTGTLATGVSRPVGGELWHWRLLPGERHTSEAHMAGTIELLHVLRGTLTVTVADREVTLPTGHALRMAADHPHAYANLGDEVTEYTGVVLVPQHQQRG